MAITITITITVILLAVIAIPILWIAKGNSRSRIEVRSVAISDNLTRFEINVSHAYDGPGEYSPQALPLLEATAKKVEALAARDRLRFAPIDFIDIDATDSK